MTKNFLLTAAAVGVLAFAGSASAHELAFRATGPAGSITTAATNADGVYALANEIAADELDPGVLALSAILSSGALPSGNSFFNIGLANATFGTPVTTSILVGLGNDDGGTPADPSDDTTVPDPTACTFVRTVGGAATDFRVVFLVSSSGAGTCRGFNVNLPILPGTVDTVTVSTEYETEAGNPIDGGEERLDVISLVDAFQPTFNGSFTANGAEGDTVTPLPGFTTVTPDGVLGRLALYVDTTAHYSLDPTDLVTVADVEEVTVTVEGALAAFNGANDPTLTVPVDPTPAGTVVPPAVVVAGTTSATLATFLDAQYIAEDLSDKPLGRAFTVTPDGGVIQSSEYEAIIQYTLDPALYDEQPEASSDDPAISATGPNIFGSDFEGIEREGTNVLLPWMNSAAQSARTGTNNIVRISNLSPNAAAVSGAVVTSNTAGVSTAGTLVPLGTVPAGGELQLQAAQLAALGDFGRGDVQIVVEADPELITVKRYAILANGSVTEFESGSVASDQNREDVP